MKYQISSTLCCRTATHTSPGGSRKCAIDPRSEASRASGPRISRERRRTPTGEASWLRSPPFPPGLSPLVLIVTKAPSATWHFVTAVCAPPHRLIDPFRRKERFGEMPLGHRLTWRRKPKGTTACRESGGCPKTCRTRSCKTRVIWRKPDCLTPQFPGMQCHVLRHHVSERSRRNGTV